MPTVEDDDDLFNDAVGDFDNPQKSVGSQAEDESFERRPRSTEIQGLRRRRPSLSRSTVHRISDTDSVGPTGEEAESNRVGGAAIAPEKGRCEVITESVDGNDKSVVDSANMGLDDDSVSINSAIESVSGRVDFVNNLVGNEVAVVKPESSCSDGRSSIFHDLSTNSVADRFELMTKLLENEIGLPKSEPSTVQYASSHCMGLRDGSGSSAVASVNMDGDDDDSFSEDSPVELGGRLSSLLVSVVRLIIKAIGFQFNLMFGFFSLPVLFVYYTFALITNPFQTLGRGSDYLVGNFVGAAGFVFNIFAPFASRWSKLTLRLGRGFLLSAYVYMILLGLLLSSFLMSGFWMQFMVEEPFRIKDSLFFDYTKTTPVANFPVTYCPGAYEVANSGYLRSIPRNQKFQVTVSLKLPESDYNRNLGVFQVRVDCLSAEGKVLATSRHPCMLPFQSLPIRFLETSLKIVPILAGYRSESQTLNVRIRDFSEGNEPTACLNVMIEARAQYRDGAGVPELYDASLLLESDLPLLKWIIWRWKKTIFIWMSMTFFMTGLLLTFVFCTPMLLPRPRPNEESVGGNGFGAAVLMAGSSTKGSC